MIFLDSSYLKGLIHNKDSYHHDALRIRDFMGDLNETTVINTTVLVETLNWSVKINTFAKKMYDEIKKENRIVNLTYDDYLEALKINCWFGNSINYSDCTIINTMFSMGISRIATFDDDFRKVSSIEVIS